MHATQHKIPSRAGTVLNPLGLAGLPGITSVGRLAGPPNVNSLLSFHAAPAGNFAAAAATGGETTLNVVMRRDQCSQSAAQPPTSEVCHRLTLLLLTLLCLSEVDTTPLAESNVFVSVLG